MKGFRVLGAGRLATLILSTNRPTVDVSWGDDTLTATVNLGRFGNVDARWSANLLKTLVRLTFGSINVLSRFPFLGTITLNSGRPILDATWGDDTLTATLDEDFGAVQPESERTARLHHVLAWAGTVVTDTDFTNQNDALGRSNNASANSTNDASDDTLEVDCSGLTPNTTGWVGLTWIPSLTQLAASCQLLGTAVVGETGQIDVVTNVATRNIFNTGALDQDFEDTIFGPQRMVSDDTNVRADLVALAATNAGLQTLLDYNLRGFHDKPAVGPTIALVQVDAMAYSMWLYDSLNGAVPNVTTMPTFVAADWNTDGRLVAANNRFENNNAALVADGTRKTIKAKSFAALLRFSADRPAAGVRNLEFQFWCDEEDSVPANFCNIRFIVGTAAANDAIELRSPVALVATGVAPNGGWATGSVVGAVGNWIIITATTASTESGAAGSGRGRITVERLRTPTDREKLFHRELFNIASATAPGWFHLKLPSGIGTSWFDDIFIIGHD